LGTYAAWGVWLGLRGFILKVKWRENIRFNYWMPTIRMRLTEVSWTSLGHLLGGF